MASVLEIDDVIDPADTRARIVARRERGAAGAAAVGAPADDGGRVVSARIS